MIRNEKQYQNTKKILKGLEDSLLEYQKKFNDGGKDEDSSYFLGMKNIESMIRKQQADIAEYENLQSGKMSTVTMNMLGEIPEILIKARIAKKWTQAQLAERVGLKEQQIQKYESTDYAGASTWKLLYIIDALEVTISPVSVQVSKPKFDTGEKAELVSDRQRQLNEGKTLWFDNSVLNTA
jgi:transcriptional regulator with XRE-family HTH domain